jgi:flagellar hook-associated protein 1 FlgK
MLGLFGTLNLGARSLQVQQQGIEVSGHNLANVNNPAYARQRINVVTSLTLPTAIGPQGTGADVARIQQLRDALLDGQIQGEASVRGFLEAQQKALQYGEAILGQQIDRTASGPEGSTAAQGVGGQHSLADGLSDFFNALQGLTTNPTASSLSERQAVIEAARTLSTQFNQTDNRLSQLHDTLNESLNDDVTKVNDLLTDIANYNKEIFTAETSVAGSANDLRDLRQQKLEELGELVNIQTSEQDNGVNVTIAGASVVSGFNVADHLQVYDAGSGQMMVRTQTGGTPLSLTGGTIQGTIDARDGALQSMRGDLNTLATALITEVNAVHSAGFSLTGSTGAAFFTGTTAADIAVNSTLANDPSLIQASGTNGAVGDSQVALQLAQLANKKLPSLSNQTFSQNYAKVVADLGQSLNSVNTNIGDQDLLEQMLLRQRDAISGVSLDEEMTELIKFQKAFQASARLISTVDEMLDTVVNMKR